MRVIFFRLSQNFARRFFTLLKKSEASLLELGANRLNILYDIEKNLNLKSVVGLYAIGPAFDVWTVRSG